MKKRDKKSLQWRDEFESAEDTESQASDMDDVDSMSSGEEFVLLPEGKKNVAWDDEAPARSPHVNKRSLFEKMLPVEVRPLLCPELYWTMLKLTRSA
jgi:hypothetical protein